MRKIGFLGPEGTFSQEALRKYLDILSRKGNIADAGEYKECSYNTLREILIAVANGQLDEALVPLENSLEGAVNEVLDIMATEVDLKFKAEIILAIKQNLLIKKGSCIEDIKHIVSHPQALGQCRKYISNYFPGAEIKPVYSTAKAAELVASGNGDVAAIGSAIAADVYDLEIHARNIQDEESNFTRFIVVSDIDGERTGHDKTSIVFSTEDRPGSLYRILDIFNLWDINMTRIESRPAKKQLGSYIFFVDIEGHREDDDVCDALTMVRRKTSFYKLLGSYPKFIDCPDCR